MINKIKVNKWTSFCFPEQFCFVIFYAILFGMISHFWLYLSLWWDIESIMLECVVAFISCSDSGSQELMCAVLSSTQLKSLGDFQNVLYSVEHSNKKQKKIWMTSSPADVRSHLLTSHPDWNKCTHNHLPVLLQWPLISCDRNHSGLV